MFNPLYPLFLMAHAGLSENGVYANLKGNNDDELYLDLPFKSFQHLLANHDFRHEIAILKLGCPWVPHFSDTLW